MASKNKKRPNAVSQSLPARHSSRKAVRISTRDKILDTAEELFAVRGFYGVSIRDITSSARVQLALVNYHFGTKQRLYEAVVKRRGIEHARGMQQWLDQVLASAAPRSPGLEAVIEAFCASIFDRLTHGGPGWQRYIQLLARSAESPQGEPFVAPINQLLDPVVKNYFEAVRAAVPGMPAADLYAAFYFLQAGLVYITANTGGIDRISKGRLHSSDFDVLLPRMVKYFAAGFRSLKP
jgi:AcrR family transcriptional regulator